MIDLLTDGELVSRAIQDDSRAFGELCNRHRRRVWRVISAVTQGPETEDLAQEAFVRAFRSLRSYRGESSFEAWITRIAVNAAHDYHRSAWKRKVLPWLRSEDEVDEGAEPLSETVARRDSQRSVRLAVAKLPHRQRVPIWLHYFEEFTVAEIARLEDTAESTIRSRILAGMKGLERSLEHLAEMHVEATDPGGCMA